MIMICLLKCQLLIIPLLFIVLQVEGYGSNPSIPRIPLLPRTNSFRRKSHQVPITKLWYTPQLLSKITPNISSFISLNILTFLSKFMYDAYSRKKNSLQIPLLHTFLTDQSFFIFSSGLLTSYFLPESFRNIINSESMEAHVWTYILPVSLILRILGGNNNRTSQSPSEKKENNWISSLASAIHTPLIIAFMFGSLSSFLAGLFTSSILSKAYLMLKVVPAQIQAAMIQIASLTASYIGGTVNFYETGNYLAETVSKSSPLLKRDILDNLNIFAAMDINVMILYFTFLQFIRNNFVLSKKRGKRIASNDSNPPHGALKSKLILPAVGIAYILCFLAVSIQRTIPNLPGLSIFLCTIFAVFWNKLQSHFKDIQPNSVSWEATTDRMSDHFLSVFYFGLGIFVNWKLLFSKSNFELFSILFSFFSVLFLHIISIFGFVTVWNQFLSVVLPKRKEMLYVDADSILIASNACVGGAATAASMSSSFQRKDLIFSASLAGIIGYMIGTPIGLTVFRLARK